MQLATCSASPPQQLSSSPLLQCTVLQRRRAVGIFRRTHLISWSSCAHQLVWRMTGLWHTGQMVIWLWSFCGWLRGFYWGDASHHQLHQKLLWAHKRQEHAFQLVSAQCLEQCDQSGPRILDATTLQMILFSNHSISARPCTLWHWKHSSIIKWCMLVWLHWMGWSSSILIARTRKSCHPASASTTLLLLPLSSGVQQMLLRASPTQINPEIAMAENCFLLDLRAEVAHVRVQQMLKLA